MQWHDMGISLNGGNVCGPKITSSTSYLHPLLWVVAQNHPDSAYEYHNLA